MSPKTLLHQVIERYPLLKQLPAPQLKAVEKAILYARGLDADLNLLSDEEHRALLKEVGPEGGRSPASRLRAYRMRAGWNQQQLAKKTGISQANISAMERGHRPIGLITAKKLAKALKAELKRFL